MVTMSTERSYTTTNKDLTMRQLNLVLLERTKVEPAPVDISASSWRGRSRGCTAGGHRQTGSPPRAVAFVPTLGLPDWRGLVNGG
eukprot:6461989-Amphidinium_carterae.1